MGIDGIRTLKELVDNAEGYILQNAIIETIYFTSKKQNNKLLFIEDDNPFVLNPVIDNEMANFADEKMHELVTESLTNKKLFGIIIKFFSQQEVENYIYDNNAFTDYIFKIFRETSIKINRKVINNFEKLINTANLTEEEYQKYLFNHPVLIDPLAKEIIPKQRLGSDYITDFVIRKFNDEYVLVEIEKPTTPIFTKANDFTSHFTHALGQVLDFQDWVERNIAYANNLMPSITAPKGLLILGMMSVLTEEQKRKIRRFNINNQGKVRVLTFDEVLENARKLYKNLIE
ncbi:Shedu anti-phage system protein SduA domain-containing protein [Lysinibacillus sp. NPDC093190]|uniref:Shedu anti-phage system protein SduA domain-containing protein n=1 Tax=Lysinibacillus sp. NPDC093190 TaxID=3390575 RepID=UPI003D03BABB